MLNIYYGSEAVNKEHFIFSKINPDAKTLLLVPDQYSLQTEENALKYLGKSSLIDVMVVDFNSLGHKVIKAARKPEPDLIDKYGRHMLLSIIVDKLCEELTLYKGMEHSNTFANKMNQLISEMKRYGVGPADLRAVIDKVEEHSYLYNKLTDIERIFTEYEEKIAGKYLDSEDYITFYGDLMGSSSVIEGADIWIYGFDTFTPKNEQIIQQILPKAHNVNIVMTCEDPGMPHPADARFLTLGGGDGLFDLTNHVIGKLVSLADEVGVKSTRTQISEPERSTIWQKGSEAGYPIVLARTSDVYAEAERAAAYINELVRDKNYRYGDIVVICNDMKTRGGIFKRTFERWDIPVFMDKKRKVLHQPVVGFVMGLMEIISRGFDSQYMLYMVKSGMLAYAPEDIELLQNYVKEFKINSSKWQKDFTIKGDYSEEDLEKLNNMRKYLVNMINAAKDEIGRRNTAGEKVRGLYSFLKNDFGLKSRIENVVEFQRKLGLYEGAAETAQSWNLICSILKQIDQITGEDRISNETLKQLIKAGLEGMEIGLLPLSNDCLVMGTIQRTRISEAKVIMVVGANENVLPMDIDNESLISHAELETLENLSVNIAKKQDVVSREEQLALYRVFTMPQELLYVSCSNANEKGESTNPSGVFTDLEKCAPGELLLDLDIDAGIEAVSSRKGTLPYIAEIMHRLKNGESISSDWKQVINWYEEECPEELNKVVSGIFFDNKVEAMGKSLADALYFGDKDAIRMSATRLEKYSRCPFAHFMKFGLNAKEQREYEISSREIGDIYHWALMQFCETNPDWDNITESQCRDTVDEILAKRSDEYKEGIFTLDGYSRFRAERIREICGDVAWAVVNQMRRGEIKDIKMEAKFGDQYDAVLPPIEVEIGNKKALIHGIIDRMDVIDTPQGEAVRIVDYKTGNPDVNPEQVRSGYKLQLMVYMNAAKGNRIPAGVFYFKIFEHAADEEKVDKSLSVDERIKLAYKLEGILVDDEEILKAMDETVEASSKAKPEVLEIKYVAKDGAYHGTGKSSMLTQLEFEELCDEAGKQVERICEEIYEGKIDVKPTIEAKTGVTACQYCDYRSACLFDESMGGRYKKA